jgi:hypothetical protein
MKGLSEANAPLDRVTLGATQKVEANDDGVPLKIEMASVKQRAAQR